MARLRKTGNFSISKETLFHFHCNECQKWWTIADIDQIKTVWFCPWCGKEKKIIKK
jgi:predicted RNA-binding Zn-ribbon protein involved in translation (DUF1610 family)